MKIGYLKSITTVMMNKERINKILRPSTIARRFAQCKLADLPADTVMAAVNSHELDYNPTAIPIRLTFPQLFAANFNAFAYLAEHNSETEVTEFLNSPAQFMAKAGVEIAVPFDETSARIFASIVEDDILSLLKTEEGIDSIYRLMIRDELTWLTRHTERYSQKYMSLNGIWGLKNIPFLLEKETVKKYGFPEKLTMGMMKIYDFLSESSH